MNSYGRMYETTKSGHIIIPIEKPDPPKSMKRLNEYRKDIPSGNRIDFLNTKEFTESLTYLGALSSRRKREWEMKRAIDLERRRLRE